MKNILFTFVVLFTSILGIQAQAPVTNDSILIEMPGKVTYPNGEHSGIHKMPVPPIYVLRTGNRLTFDCQFIGMEVDLLSSDIIVDSYIIDENGQVLLPETLTGIYELRLSFSTITYSAEILF